MSDDSKKTVHRLVPGEPVPQFGGMTPEQFASFAMQIQEIVLGTFQSYDGTVTLHNYLIASTLLEVEEAAGTEAMQTALATIQTALLGEIEGQRKRRQVLREREQAAHEHDKGLN